MAKKTIQIKNRYTDEVIFETEADSIKEAVEIAVRSEANLSRADLSRANLSRADLSRANLSEANLWRADLVGANLSRADLSRANLSEADLSEADLSEANLWRANLVGADLVGADLNAIFYKTKITKKQKTEIVESDLFEVVDDSTSYSSKKEEQGIKMENLRI